MDMLYTACLLVGFSQDLSTSQQCFPLTTNQHQPGLSAQKPTSEKAVYRKEDWLTALRESEGGARVTTDHCPLSTVH